MSDQQKLVAKTIDFVSFLVSEVEIRLAVLHGAVANNEFDDESDINLFIESDDKEAVMRRLKLWELSSRAEMYRLQGITNIISLRISSDGKESSKTPNGIVLYGRRERSNGLRKQLIFTISFSKPSLMLIRKLYGHTQKVNGRVYHSEGLLQKLNGIKLQRGIMMIPAEESQKMYAFLKENKLKYTAREVWVE